MLSVLLLWIAEAVVVLLVKETLRITISFCRDGEGRQQANNGLPSSSDPGLGRRS